MSAMYETIYRMWTRKRFDIYSGITNETSESVSELHSTVSVPVPNPSNNNFYHRN